MHGWRLMWSPSTCRAPAGQPEPPMHTPEDSDSGTSTGAASAGAPVGVRAAIAATSGTARPLRWVQPGAYALTLGDRVAVRDAEGDSSTEWLGTVVIPSAQLLEWPAPEVISGWPVVVRRATADEWPAGTVTDGSRLLESLGLPPSRLRRPGYEF
jgi:hypothetical protein